MHMHIWTIFTMVFWVEKDRGRERILADFIGACPTGSCGGKIHAVVTVGFIKDGHYLVKNSDALWKDDEFPLLVAIRCTNCKIDTVVPKEASRIISDGAGEFARSLREVRQQGENSQRN
ncbi:MAG: hypothetical protein HYT49_02585 [Candidatus Wildermuthbacteria bacterium]|nr:hypothetical protein [Candidatus Wildermuthbacteria bacterium]